MYMTHNFTDFNLKVGTLPMPPRALLEALFLALVVVDGTNIMSADVCMLMFINVGLLDDNNFRT